VNSIRLLPIVLVAVTALFLLKGIGLITQGGYILVGANPALAQAQPDSGQTAPDGAAMELTPAEVESAQRAADALFAEDPAGTPDPNGTPGGAQTTPPAADGAAPETAVTDIPANGALADGISPTEEAVLRRLRERREALDAREKELELRVGLVNAAEARLNERIAELQAIEARVQALVDQRKVQDDEQFAALVSMYENMKSGDAAAVFNTLSMEVLLRLAINMNPRKMSPILANMQTQRAQELTVRMATSGSDSTQGEMTSGTQVQSGGNLPQIVGQ
jgi:flagellar motility protein MotE (MotC chaperone)